MTPRQKKPMSADKALERLMTMCVSAEHCTYEMLTKLSRWGIGQADASRIVARLRQEKFIDDRRFAVAYANDKARFNAWGSRKIRLGLMQKRIAADDIAAALAEVDPDDFRQGLMQTLRGKILSMGSDEISTYEGRTKIFRHAASRGFEPEMIARMMRDRSVMEELTR